MLPNVKETIIDGGLGIAPLNKDGVFAIVARHKDGANDTEAKAFTNINDVYDVYGSEKTTLTKYAECAFQNGAGKLWLVATANDAADTSKLIDGVDLLKENEDIRGIYVAEKGDNVLAVALQTKADEFLAAHRPLFFIMDANDTADFSGVNAKYVSVCKHEIDYVNGKGEKWSGSVGAALLGILSKSPVSRSAGSVRFNAIVNAVSKGSLSEAEIDTLNAGRFVTARTITGAAGIYITNANTFAPAGSDYTYLETVRTMFKAMRNVRAAMLPNLHADLPAVGEDMISAVKDLESQAQVPLNRMQSASEISAAEVSIDPTQDFIGTGTVNVDLTIVPRFVARAIHLRFALKNPAL